jgi:predicted nucleic acid-binding protein
VTRPTIDANILVYSIETGDHRQEAAIAIIAGAARAGGLITVQALGEFFFATTRQRKLAPEAAMRQVALWSTAFGAPLPQSPAALTEAMAAAAAGRFSFWDAMLLTTAAQAGCTAIISEDMAPGTQLGPIRVIPAFAGAEVSPEALALLA